MNEREIFEQIYGIELINFSMEKHPDLFSDKYSTEHRIHLIKAVLMTLVSDLED